MRRCLDALFATKESLLTRKVNPMSSLNQAIKAVISIKFRLVFPQRVLDIVWRNVRGS